MAPGQFLQKCDKRGEVSPCGKPHAARRQYVVEQWNHDFVVHYISDLNNFIVKSEINKKQTLKRITCHCINNFSGHVLSNPLCYIYLSYANKAADAFEYSHILADMLMLGRG